MAGDVGRSRVAELIGAKSVAVVGASEDQTKFGGRLFRMLLRHRFSGAIHPVNPGRSEIFGVPTVPDIASLPEAPDLAVVAIPTKFVPDAVAACAARGTKGVIIITAQFSDAGPDGARVEQTMVEDARRHGTRIWGPNCLGLISPARGLVLCSSPALEVDALIRSPIGFVTQSGALMGTLFDRMHTRGFGFSHIMSVGNQADLELCDFVEFLIDDDATEVICTYVEGVKDPVRFREVAKRVRAAGKPWLMLKAGRTEAGAQAAFSHTASLAGSYRAFQAVCEENGITLVDDQDAMQLLAASLVRFPKRRVRHVALMTPSGGSSSLVSDRLADAGIALSGFDTGTSQALSDLGLPNVANPVDYGGNAAPVVRSAMEIVAHDGAVDAALCVITTAPALDQACAALVDAAAPSGLPLLFVMHPGRAADAARRVLIERQIPFANTLDEGITALAHWIELGAAVPEDDKRRPDGLPDAVALPAGGTLGEQDTKRLLSRYGIRTPRDAMVRTSAEAEHHSAELSFPVVVKVSSADLPHKSDVGGVALNLHSPAEVGTAIRDMEHAVRKAAPAARIDGYLIQEMASGGAEFIVGISTDAQFGPVVVVGAGGILVELLDDVAIATAPVSIAGAGRMIARLKAARLLAGIRGGPPLDAEALAELVSRVSWLAADLCDRLEELDINPVLVQPVGTGCIALDGRALLRETSSQPSEGLS